MTRKSKLRASVAIGAIFLFLISTGLIFWNRDYSKLSITVPLFIFTMMAVRRLKKPQSKLSFNNRLTLFWYVCVFFTLLLIIRLFNIQVVNSTRYEKRANEQANRINEVVGRRGKIFDSKDRVLAYDENEYDFIINPRIINRSEKAVDALIEIDKRYQKLLINPSKAEIERLSQAKRGAGYKVVARNMSEETRDAILDYLRENKIYVGSAIQLKEKTKRNYNDRSLESILGLVAQTKNSEGKRVGVFGVESMYENYLKGRHVKRRSLFTNARDMKLPTSADHLEISADGRDLHLTIDSFLQYILTEEVKRKYDETQAEEAVGIIMDPNSGKVLATTAFSRKKGSLRNPIIQNQYEPGSTFKPIIVGAALEDGDITPRDTFDVGDGRLKKYNHTIRESSRHTRGVLTLSEVLEKSSNIGMVHISDKMESSRFEEYLRKFGLGEQTGVDLPGEVSPYLPPSRRWDGLRKNTMSFGQGIVMTPLQLATAFSAVVNGGKLYKPYVVEKITDENGVVIRRNIPEVREQVISPEVSAQLREILRRVVAEGTGRGGRVEGYDVGGKTGTAQISGPGGYISGQYLASFVGFFPADNPEYVILTMFKKPQAKIYYNRFGGVVAAPVFSKVANRIINYREMKPEEVKILEEQSYRGMESEYQPLAEIPDLKGRSVREAMRILSGLDVDIEVEGRGVIKDQLPKKGTSLENVRRIKLYLE